MEKVKPLVSVIITTRNRYNLLIRAVNSVLNQTYENIELIVVSDASTDETDIYLEENKSVLTPIIIKKEQSRGGNYARNQGIKKANGKFVSFLDDDDYWMSDKIECQIDLALKENFKFVYCSRRFEFINKDGISFANEKIRAPKIRDYSKFILCSICTTTSCILVERELLLKVGMFDENLKFWQEYELSIRLAQECEFGFFSAPLVVYRIDINDKNRLTNKYYEWLKAVEYIHNKHKDLYEKQSMIDHFMSRALFYFDASNRLSIIGKRYKSMYYWIVANIISLPYRIKSRIL